MSSNMINLLQKARNMLEEMADNIDRMEEAPEDCRELIKNIDDQLDNTSGEAVDNYLRAVRWVDGNPEMIKIDVKVLELGEAAELNCVLANEGEGNWIPVRSMKEAIRNRILED